MNTMKLKGTWNERQSRKYKGKITQINFEIIMI